MVSPFDTAVELLRQSERPVVFTGAGVSQESGIPTFRDAQVGLWEHFRPEDLATPEAFREDPALVLGFYEYRRSLIDKCEPNAAHRAIAEFERRKPTLAVITQNVDGFHRRVGNRRVLEVHGDIFLDRCHQGCPGTVARAPLPEDGLPGTCPSCGRRSLRPAVVWFGEGLDPTVWSETEKFVADCDLMLTIGTSGLVYPAASLPQKVAMAGKPLIEINPDRTPLSEIATVYLPFKAAEILPRILERL